MKVICSSCGWEILNPQWWNSWNNKTICDECDTDEVIKREREGANGQR